jgi:hypothetical protein
LNDPHLENLLFLKSFPLEPRHPLVSNHNQFHLIERDLIARAVIELRRPRRFVRGDRLGILDRAAIFEIRGDPVRPEGVAARGGGESVGNVPAGGRGELVSKGTVGQVRRVQSQCATELLIKSAWPETQFRPPS